MKWLLLSLLSFNAHAGIIDKYPNYASLAQNEVINRDYRISLQDRGSTMSIFAIHGGLIEPGSDRMAVALATDQKNLYVFEGIKKEDPMGLHITATRFDEPEALALAQKSQNCVSIHGYIGNGSKAICVGGNDQKLATHLVQKLQAAKLDLEVIHPCKAFPASHPKNIVNRCRNQGVQLEISQGLWDAFSENTKLENDVIKVLRDALEAF